MKEEKFPNTRKPSHRWVCGEFWNLRGQHNKKETNKQTNQPPQILCLNTTPSTEVALMLACTNCTQGLSKEARAACLR